MVDGSNRNLYLAACIACMTGALFGYSVGFIGGILVLPSFLHHFRLDNLPPSDLAAAQAATVSTWLVGALFGVPLGMPVCSRCGRRRCLSFSALLYVLGAGLQMMDVHGSLAVFDVGRLLNGLGVGAGTLVSPMYISEISPPSQRGMLLSGYQTAIQLAALAGFWAAFAAHSTLPDTSSLQWRIPVAVQLVPGVLLLLGSFLVPEVPRFLAEKGQMKAAEDALAWLRGLPRGHSGASQALEELRQAIEDENTVNKHRQPLWRELGEQSVRKRLAVGTGLMIAQNMVGLNALNYYAPTIFISAGFTSVSASLFLTGFFGVIKVLSATSFMFIFVRMRGNRFWLKIGSAVCGISMLILAYCVRKIVPSPQRSQSHDSAHLTTEGLISVAMINPSKHPHSAAHTSHLSPEGIISVAMVYIFAFAFGISLGPISWNVCSEIFPSHIKATCCAVTTCVQWVFRIVIAGITPHLLAKVGWSTYVVYTGFCAVSFIWVWWNVPETRGVPLGRPMDELFGGKEGELGGVEGERAEEEEVTERSALLSDRYRGETGGGRRDSIGFPV